jgi:glycerol-3-phosphate dehydrogenase (NAD(P)+)
MVTLASLNQSLLRDLQIRIYSPFFKCYVQHDVPGVELSGAVKNILALGAGYVDGKGYGYNTMAAFVTRGIKEV